MPLNLQAFEDKKLNLTAFDSGGALPSLASLDTSTRGSTPQIAPQPTVSALDVAKEIPGSLVNVSREIGQSILRSFVAFGKTDVLKPFVEPLSDVIAEQQFKDQTFNFFTEELNRRLTGTGIGGDTEFKGLFGETAAEEARPIEERILDFEQDIRNKGTELANSQNIVTRKIGQALQKTAPELAFLGIGGLVGLDMSGFGGSRKGATQAIKNTKTEGQALKVLNQLNVPDDVAREVAPLVVKAKTDEQAGKVLTDVVERVSTQKSVIPRELQPLAEEARKFKTAEEFVDAQPTQDVKIFRQELLDEELTKFRNNGFEDLINPDKSVTVYHKTTPLRASNIERTGFNEGAFFATSEEAADALASTNKGKASKIMEIKVDPASINFNEGTGEIEALGKLTRQEDVYKVSDEIIKKDFQLTGLTKSQLTDFFNRVKTGATPTQSQRPPVQTPRGRESVSLSDSSLDETVAPKADLHKSLTSEGRQLVDEEGNVVFPQRSERAPTPIAKPALIDDAKEALKRDKEITKALSAIGKKHGSVDNIIAGLEKKGVPEDEINKIVLEDGTKLVDAVKVKRETNGVLSAVITKRDLDEIRSNFTLDVETDKWIPTKTGIQKVKEAGRQGKLAALEYYELPQVFFDRTGLRSFFYDPIREAERNANKLKNNLYAQFEEAGLYKRGGWFTADRIDLRKKDAEEVARYYLTRQQKNVDRVVDFEELSEKAREFVRIFDGVIKQTEDKFFKVAELNGKEPGKVPNYAPLMTSRDMKLAQEMGDVEFIFRKHPAFFSLKKRKEDVPFDVYELDYRQVATRWIDQMANFLHLGEVGTQTKYLAQSDEFKEIVGDRVFNTTNKWLQDVFNPSVPDAVGATANIARQAGAISSLGLNLASVMKQMLTQVPLTFIEKAPPKLQSQFAKEFGIDVKNLPSIRERKGNAAIMDMQEGVRRAFVGPLTEFDKINAQKSLNALLDKEHKKFLKEGKEMTPERQAQVLKLAQDRLDMWFGGMTRAQLPRAFRSELGKLINMFIMPLTSQLNGFFFSVAKAKGYKKAEVFAEVVASALTIAYLEQVITNWSPKWSDEKSMTEDVLISLSGNIPLLSQAVFAWHSDQPLQVSPVLSSVSRVVTQLGKVDEEQTTSVDVGFAFAELFGVPKQFRRTVEGVGIVTEGGLRDRDGKLLAPVKGTDEHIRAFIRGKYGTIATQDFIRNVGVSSDKRRWFVPEVEFLQNGDYDRKAELYVSFDTRTQRELYAELSEGQQKRLEAALEDRLTVSLPEIELPEISLPEITLPEVSI